MHINRVSEDVAMQTSKEFESARKTNEFLNEYLINNLTREQSVRGEKVFQFSNRHVYRIYVIETIINFHTNSLSQPDFK